MGTNGITNNTPITTSNYTTGKKQDTNLSTGQSDLEKSIFTNDSAKRVYEYNLKNLGKNNMTKEELQNNVAKSFGLGGKDKAQAPTSELSPQEQQKLNTKTEKFGEKFVEQLKNGTTFDNVNYCWNNQGENYDKKDPNNWNRQASVAFSQGILNATDNRGFWDKDTKALQDVAKTYDKSAEDVMKVADLNGDGKLTANEYTSITAFGDTLQTNSKLKNDGINSETERNAAMENIFKNPEETKAALQKINTSYGIQKAYTDYMSTSPKIGGNSIPTENNTQITGNNTQTAKNKDNEKNVPYLPLPTY